MKKITLSLLALLVFAPLSQAKTLPLDDFIRHGDYLNIIISPDGQHLAATYREKSTVTLLFIHVKDKRVVSGFNLGSNNEIWSVKWVNNERVVFELAEKFNYLDRPIPTGELIGINVDQSHYKVLYGYRAGDERVGSRITTRDDARADQEVLSILENDHKNIQIIEHPWAQRGQRWYRDGSREPIISKLNVYSGKKRRSKQFPSGAPTHWRARVVKLISSAGWIKKTPFTRPFENTNGKNGRN